MVSQMIRIPVASTALLLLGGCATYATPPVQSYSYFVVPCSTPGAFPAEPMAVMPSMAGVQPPAPPTYPAPAGVQQPAYPAPAGVSSNAAAPQQTCMIAVAAPGSGYRRSYYGGGYYDPYYYGYGGYGRPFYGSIGIGFFGGGHGGGGHGGFGGGHGGFGGGHGGGGHGGGHGGH